MIITPDSPINYCIVCNEVARRIDISARAKGIYYYLATLPADWELQQQEAEKHFTEGREAFRTAFKELIDKGYIIADKIKDSKGRLSGWKYKVLWTSIASTENTKTDTPENLYRKNRQTENPTLLNTNNNNYLIEELLNIDSIESINMSESGFLEKFEEFRKAYPGTKRKLETEYSEFKKKNKNYGEIIELLLPAIKQEIKHKDHLRDNNMFVAQFKHLKTWLNQRCWELEFNFNVQSEKKEGREIFAFEKNIKGKYDDFI